MQNFTVNQLFEIYNSGPDATIILLQHLLATNQQLQEQIAELTKEVDTLRTEVKSLEAQLAKDSHNSHKPPSSDGLKRKPKSLRGPSERRSGGQKGHTGHTLKRVAKPDKVQVHKAQRCPCCSCSLKDVAVENYESRQVFDIPPVSMEVTEHRAEIKICPHCQTRAKGHFPASVTQPVQYGSRVKAQVIYFVNQHLLPYKRTCEILNDLYGHQLSEGTIYNIQKSCYQSLEEPVALIKSRILASPVAHFDETGLRAEKKLHWLHTVGTAFYSFYHVHQKRGREAIDHAGILPFFFGIAVHDFWKPYLKYNTCSHSLCNAHLLRDLIFVIEQRNERKKQQWAIKMKKLLLHIKSEIEKATATGKQSFDKTTVQHFEQKYRDILAIGFKENPEYPCRRKRKKRTDAQNLLRRLETYSKWVLAFMYDFAVPFDNNQAERDLRMIKVHQKVSGCFRSFDGAEMFCRIKSYLATAKKQQQNSLDAIQSILLGKKNFLMPTPE